MSELQQGVCLGGGGGLVREAGIGVSVCLLLENVPFSLARLVVIIAVPVRRKTTPANLSAFSSLRELFHRDEASKQTFLWDVFRSAEIK